MTTNRLAIVLISTLVCTAGCASTIGNPSKVDEVTFAVGSTHKNEVANALGFPQNRAVEDGTEYWGYRDTPELSGIVYAVPTGANTVTTYQTAKARSKPLQMDSVDIIYAFDGNGTLVDIYEPAED